MLPNLGVIWVIVLILVLTVILDRLMLRPILEVIRKREGAVASARELARRAASEAQTAAAEFDRTMTAARADLYQEMDEMRRTAMSRRADIVAQTRAEAERQIAEASRRLDDEAARARRTLDVEAQALGASAAARILGRPAS